MILRFDDTNPDKENVAFEHAIVDDLKSLRIRWDVGPTYTSDYFEQMLLFAEKLIKEGKVCSFCCLSPAPRGLVLLSTTLSNAGFNS